MVGRVIARMKKEGRKRDEIGPSCCANPTVDVAIRSHDFRRSTYLEPVSRNLTTMPTHN